MRPLVTLLLLLIPVAVFGDPAQIVISGEVHDNPAHQRRHATLAADINARAIVFEMLTQAQADRVTPELIRDRDRLQAALGWNATGWPDFAAYYPIFTAVPGAKIFGAAVPRDVARAAFENGVAGSFGPDAGLYGLTADLPADQQDQREQAQLAAHCGALPADLLPRMVAIQRLRDATLARTALRALDATGGPVLIVTGNGHARRDWGVPVYIAAARPGVRVTSHGHGETGAGLAGAFDSTRFAPPVSRTDPCAAFDKG